MKKINFFSQPEAYYKGPKSDHFDGIRFFNPWDPQTHSLYQLLRWKIRSIPKKWPTKKEAPRLQIPLERVEGNQLRITFVGHSTMLIQTQGLNIITDPIWSTRASPFKYLGPARYSNPGIPLEKLPPIDLILISHNHYDHLDINTIKKIWHRDRARIIAPLGNDAVIHLKAPSIPVETLDWYQKITIQNGVTIHLTPTQHWSARGFSDRNKALWGAFIISTTGGNIYFCGDSGYGNGEIFRKVHQLFGSFRFAMLPIGAFEPRWFMKYFHMNPEEAVLAYKDLGKPYAAAIHFKTFRLADEGFHDATRLLAEACVKYQIDPQKFRALQLGESWIVP